MGEIHEIGVHLAIIERLTDKKAGLDILDRTDRPKLVGIQAALCILKIRQQCLATADHAIQPPIPFPW